MFDSSSIDILEISNNPIIIYPNPSKGLFHINLSLIQYNNIALNLFDITGRLVYFDLITNNNNYTIDIKDRSEGIYILNLEIDGKQYQKRIINLE